MTYRASRRICLAFLLICAAAVFAAGINWGLPTSAVDPFLFGDRTPWNGEQITELAPREQSSLAADVDRNPLSDRSQAIVVNATDQQRAEIVRRYRLFSCQPDEMITFSALSEMNPTSLKLDPKLYQYGGLWIYPIGLLLKLASVAGLVPLRNDPVFYLDHPEAFGRFYVVARLYVVAFGLLGVWAVFWLANRATSSLIAASGAAFCYMLLPVVVNMSHEAKPHLPGAVLILCAVMAATRFVETGKTRWWVAAAILCGAAAGMVLTAAVGIVIIPLMVVLRESLWARRFLLSAAGIVLAVTVYCATNPYVVINLVINRALLKSNFANTAAMYDVANLGAGFSNGIKLIREGGSLGILVAGVIAALALSIRAVAQRRAEPITWLLGAPAILITIHFIVLAAGKPGEYGRFVLIPDIALALAATCAVSIFARRAGERLIAVILLALLAAVPSWFYLRGFWQDASSEPTRLDEARWINELGRAGGARLGIVAEPAPYSLPPVDLFQWQITLLPRGFNIAFDETDVDVIVRAVDELGPNGVTAGPFVRQSLLGPADAFPTRISWAAKPFEAWVRRDLLDRITAPPASQ